MLINNFEQNSYVSMHIVFGINRDGGLLSDRYNIRNCSIDRATKIANSLEHVYGLDVAYISPNEKLGRKAPKNCFRSFVKLDGIHLPLRFEPQSKGDK